MKTNNEEKIQEILERLKKLTNELPKKQKSFKENFLDNQEFIQLMHVSKKTAQLWRTSGTIGYSMIGNKIYYFIKDIDKMLRKHYVSAIF